MATKELTQFDMEGMSSSDIDALLANESDPSLETDDTAPAPSGGKEPESEAIEPKVDAQPVVTATPPAKGTEQDSGAGDAAGVFAKDGKTVLPFGLLKDARTRAYQAEMEVERLTKQLQQVTQDAQSGAATVGETDDAIREIQTAADALRDDAPHLADSLTGVVKVVGALQSKLDAVRKDIESERATQQQTAAKTLQEQVDEAIDRNADLVLWRANHPDVFNMAAAIDASLREHPVWGAKSFDERFAEVARQTREAIPTAPTAAQPAATPKPTPQGKSGNAAPKPVPQDTGEAPVRTLSDLPGGAVPGADPLDNILQQDSATLQAQFMEMSPEKLLEVLARTSGY